MRIVYGMYSFRAKRLKFRNDYCLSCQAFRRSVLVRTVDVGHFYWIPVLPLGVWKRWRCTVCGKQPHVRTTTRRAFKWVGLVLLIGLAATFWAAPMDPDFVVGTWVIRVVAPVAAILTFGHLLRAPKDISLERMLAGVVPASDTVCPFCGAQLMMLGPESSCPICGVVRV